MKEAKSLETQEKSLHLQLLREAVAAQIRLWDARSALEKAMAPDGEYSDRADNESFEHIRFMAAGLDSPDDAFIQVTEEHLEREVAIAHL